MYKQLLHQILLKILKFTRKVSVIFQQAMLKQLFNEMMIEIFLFQNSKLLHFQGIKEYYLFRFVETCSMQFFLIAEVDYYITETISTFLNNVHGVTDNLQKIIAQLIKKPVSKYVFRSKY